MNNEFPFTQHGLANDSLRLLTLLFVLAGILSLAILVWFLLTRLDESLLPFQFMLNRIGLQ